MQSSWIKRYPERVSPEISFGSFTSINQYLSQAFQKYAHRPAVSCLGTTLTYRDVSQAVDRFASFLQNRLEIAKGDRVAVVIPNMIQFPIIELAILKIGGVCVNTNPQYTSHEMSHQFKDSEVSAVVVLDLFADKVQEIKEECRIKHIVLTSMSDQMPIWSGLAVNLLMRLKGESPKCKKEPWTFAQAMTAGSTVALKPVDISLDDLAILQYTGGTTGRSKGAMLTHQNILANILQVQEFVKTFLTQGQETVLTALPLYHIFSLTVNFLSFFGQGQHMILIPKPVPIANTSKVFKKYPISVMTGVNTLFNSLNNCPLFSSGNHRQLKVAIAGGMALQEHVSRRFRETTGAPILEGYGLTEASPVTHINPLRLDNPIGSIGIPLPSTLAKIVDPDGYEVANGEIGELVIKGPQVMKGYWKQPEETSKILKDGWLWTGDLARVNEDGYFFIVDRKKDMILVSGFNVYPNEVEEVISSHPMVLEAAVTGIKDASGSEIVTAFVVKRDPELTEVTLKDHCKKQLAAYKLPKRIQFMDVLPKSNVGKILRRELRDRTIT